MKRVNEMAFDYAWKDAEGNVSKVSTEFYPSGTVCVRVSGSGRTETHHVKWNGLQWELLSTSDDGRIQEASFTP